MSRDPSHQRWRVPLLVFLPPILILAGVAVVAIIGDLDIGDITRDPVTILEGHPLVGAVSAFGVILWWFTASVCFFSFAISRPMGLPRPVKVFLLTSSLLTLLLAIDDQFLIHDDLASRYLGLRERHVMIGYAVLAVAYLILNRAVIRKSEWPILAAALVFFGASIAADYLTQGSMENAAGIGVGLDWGLFLEDGLKLIGIAGWSAYLVRFSYLAVTPQEEHPLPETGST